ncbi:MAG TPA: Flp pilus assembly protein CpaB [Actinomycetota bacterium]
MKGRGLVVMLALVLATLATAGVFLYARGVQEEAQTGGAMVAVVVSKVDIPARTNLDQLIKDDQFKLIQVPRDAVVDGAVTSVDQLRGKNNSVAILAGEQIPVARVSGTVPGGALAIPEGMEAINVPLDASRAVAGAINTGDQVVIYSTFKNVPTTTTSGTQAKSTAPTVTVVLVPSAEVLAVYRPVSSNGGVFNGDSATQTGSLPGSMSITLALSPEDSQHFVFAMETGSVWLGLLPPRASGQPMKPISYAQVVK